MKHSEIKTKHVNYKNKRFFPVKIAQLANDYIHPISVTGIAHFHAM